MKTATRVPPAAELNLDAMPHDDLVALAMALGNGRACGASSVRAARALFPDRPKGYVSATDDLRCYAWNKAAAITCRLGGDIQAASLYESICDGIYERLPDFARSW